MLQTTNNQLTEFLGLDNAQTLVYGEAATGKTCLCIMTAIENAKRGKVVFIDTEGGFSTDRISQICPDNQEILKNIFLIRAKSFKQQHDIIQNLQKMNNISLIIIDTIGNFFRTIVRSHKDLANACLKKQLSILKKKTKEGIPVLITTQVYTDLSSKRIEPIGGYILKSFCPSILRLEKIKHMRIPKRTITIEKPKLKISSFKINNSGITIVP